MFRQFSANFAVFSIFTDALIVALALFLSSGARVWFNRFPLIRTIPDPVDLPLPLFVLFPVVWVGVLLLFSVYDGRQNLRVVNELSSLTFGSLLALISMAGVLYLSFRDVSRFLFLFTVALAFGLMVSWRLLARLMFRWNVWSTSNRRVLILGAGVVGRQLAQHFTARPSVGLELVGFLDDDPAKQRQQADVLGSLDAVRRVVNSSAVDDVVVALPLSAYARLNQMVTELHDLPVRVWVIPDYFSLSLHHASVEEFAGFPMLDLRAPALSEYQRMVKRAFDLILTLCALPPALLLMGLIAVAVRLDSPGPIFYRQKRVGENGCTFEMVKFRTMVDHADSLRASVETVDEQGQLIHKRAGDPRVTRVGHLLRCSSLDELPQLFNVLKGEMSLVGPRPEMPYLVEKYQPWQRKRFAVPQGMTGWWQINGRSDKPMHLHTEEDLYYVQHYSIWLDLQILLRTVWVVVHGKGAF